METKTPGYVYILTNPSFKEDWVKIGKSSRPVEMMIANQGQKYFSYNKKTLREIRLDKENKMIKIE